MYNLLKSEILKFKWSNYILSSVISIVAIFTIYLLAGDSSFLYSGNRYIVGSGVGFVSSVYENIKNPTFGEIVRTAMVGTGFIWMVILPLSVSFFVREYSENTVKLSIAYGQSRFKIYLSKFIVVSVFSLILYCLLTLSIFAHSSITMNFNPTLSEFFVLLKLITLNFLVIEIFIMISLVVSMIIKNLGAISTIMCFFILSLPMVYMMVWDKLDSQSFIIKSFLKINPMYYWSTISAYNLNNNIIHETVMYVLISTVILIPLSYIILRREEIK